MNEEFAVLKGLIPACTGEMHKLAILQVSQSVGHAALLNKAAYVFCQVYVYANCQGVSQASIEYVRYLEDCITQLKAQHSGRNSAVPTPREFRPALRELCDDGDRDWTKDVDEDVEMTDSETPSPTFTNAPAPRSNQSSISPALVAQDAQTRPYPYSTTDQRHYSFSTSPAVDPQGYPYAPGTASASHSALTSPALRPQLEIDHEVSAALLMLGSVDRRLVGSKSAGSARGMRVLDLLSS
jgi:hypothetical protein